MRLGLGLAERVAALHFPDGHLVYAWLEYRVRVRCRVRVEAGVRVRVGTHPVR